MVIEKKPAAEAEANKAPVQTGITVQQKWTSPLPVLIFNHPTTGS